MVKEYRLIKIIKFYMRVNLLMEKKKEMGNIFMKMAIIMLDND